MQQLITQDLKASLVDEPAPRGVLRAALGDPRGRRSACRAHRVWTPARWDDVVGTSEALSQLHTMRHQTGALHD
jgi:hypothetical protein